MRWIERLLDKSTPIKSYQALSGDWVTCAVGEAQRDFPAVVVKLDDCSHTPHDERLYQLGTAFDAAVAANQRRKALKIYDQIQARVRALIARE